MEAAALKILVVEDDDDHAALTLRSLDRSGVLCAVDRVKDGDQSLEYLRHQGQYADTELPDLVLLDLKLPKRNGLEVLEEMRRDPILMLVPVIMLTTSNASRDRDRAYKAHVNSYLVKPSKYPEFRQLIAEVTSYWGKLNRPPAYEQIKGLQ